MGCNVSHHHGPTFPARLRPLLLQRFDEIKAHRHQACHPLKETTPSKKELLSPDDIDRNTDDDTNAYQRLIPPSKTEDHAESEPSKNHDNKDHDVIEENVVKNEEYKIEVKEGPRAMEEDRVKAKAEDVLTDADEDVEDDDDDDDSDGAKERKIGRGEDGAFPGSPSFRVYFKDDEVVDGHGGIGTNDASKKKPVSSKEGTQLKQEKLKKGMKKRSFRKVLPKNLLGVKYCYTASHHHHSHNTTT